MLHNQRGHHNEKPVTSTKGRPCLVQLENAPAKQSKRRPISAKKGKKKLKKAKDMCMPGPDLWLGCSSQYSGPEEMDEGPPKCVKTHRYI